MFDSASAEFRERKETLLAVEKATNNIKGVSRERLESLYLALLENHVLLLETIQTTIHRKLNIAPDEYNTVEKIETNKSLYI